MEDTMDWFLSPVERTALEASPFDAIYPPTEKLPVIVVPHFPALGRLAALRFVEWALGHPGGVIALPTGKTPEHFIRCVTYLLQTWESAETRSLLEEHGIESPTPPDLADLHFVQIDDFYPIHPDQPNSFHHYVNRFYVREFGLDPAKALLIDGSRIGLTPDQTLDDVWPDRHVDLTLRHRLPATALERTQKTVLHNLDQWCQEREEHIRSLGGLGFLLGGIGPDGHIGFNVRGSDHHSTTRLARTNYETQAAAAADLGGIDVARKRLVITLGLGTLTYNPDGTAILLAAGAAKAAVVADAVQQAPHVLYPATALHALPRARLYVTAGATERLDERRLHLVTRREAVGSEEAARAVIDLAVRRGKRLVDLDDADFRSDPLASAVLARRPESRQQLTERVRDELVRCIENGSRPRRNTRFLHTEPHHDDVMLGELPYVVRHTRDASNASHFATLTSGFTSVANRFMRENLGRLAAFLDTPACAELLEEGYFDPANKTGRQRDVWQYLDGVTARSDRMKDEGIARRLLRDLLTLSGPMHPDEVKTRIGELDGHLRREYTGARDPEPVQRLKGMSREWEAECLWGYFGWHCSNVMHLRLGFYTGDLFTEEPTLERDVKPVVRLLERTRPDVVSLALDPEASGPDTHYKVLQAITRALELYADRNGRDDLTVVGYRNVWYRFHPAEANLFVPVSLNMFEIMESAFTHAFISQRDAQFPSPEHEGPFSELAQKIQVEQYETMKTCLGREWFYEHPSALIRATRGLVYLKEMNLAELLEQSRALRAATENR
jgi:glucosamine-6-phosphate deaminase